MSFDRNYAAGVPEIYYTSRGDKKTLEVVLPYAKNNKQYLQFLRNSERRTTVTFNSERKSWSLPPAQYALLRKELLMKHGEVEITIIGSTVEKCTTMCANADPGTSSSCECICMGVNHGSSISGYKEVADYLLVRSTGFSQTVRISLKR